MGVATPPQITEAFATSGTANTIPVASQIGITPGAASFTDGFPPLTATPLGSGGIPPSVGDMNGILKMISAHTAYLQSGAGYTYSSEVSTAIGGYNQGAVLLAADGAGYWYNLVPNNTANPDTGGTGWIPVNQYGLSNITGLTGGTVTLTAPQYEKLVIYLSGTLSSNLTLVFPALPGVEWLVVNNTSGAFTCTCKTPSGTGVVIANGGWAAAGGVISDGTNLYSQAGSFVTSASLSATLASYVTSATLAATLSSYVTNSALTAQLANYVTTGTLTADLANYLTTSAAASTYVSNSALTTRLASYLTTATAASTYVSQSLLATTLSAYVTATQLSAYATKTYADGTFVAGVGGYVVLPNGFYMQNGTMATPVTLTAVTFTPAFPTACYGVYPCIVSSAGAAGATVWTTPPTRTGFSIEVYENGYPISAVNWLAIGN